MRRDLRLYVTVALAVTAVYTGIDLWLALGKERFSLWFGIWMPWAMLALLILENAVVVLTVRFLLPKALMNPERRRFTVRSWETRLYARLGVRKWTPFIPELGQLADFRKDKIRSDSPEYLYRFLEETSYAELMHVWTFVFGALPALVFGTRCLYCTLPMSAVNLLMQIPPVMIQRYNRPKLKRVYEKRCRQAVEAVAAKAERV